MHELTDIAFALSDATRLRIIGALRKGEVCVCQLIELFALSPATISQHLAILREAGLITQRREGKWMYYSLATHATGDSAPATPLVSSALAWLDSVLHRDPTIRTDRSTLSNVLKVDPEVLCCQQRSAAMSKGRPRTRATTRRTPPAQACCSSAPETPAAARWPKGGPGTSERTRSRPTRPARTRTA
jgi:ArsR family transcriptional regulator